MERNGWRILVEDNSQQAHVGWTWLQFTTVGSITLLSVVGPVAEVTGDAHWRELYDRFGSEKNGERWNKWLQPDAVAAWPPLTLYANQFCQALIALQRAESNPQRRQQLAEFLRRWTTRALEANVFDPKQWRRLDWAGERDDAATRELLKPLGLTLDKSMTAVELYRAFNRKWWSAENKEIWNLNQKLCIGLATVPLHGALLSGGPALVKQAAPVVRNMVAELLREQRRYDRGENFNRTVILGLLLEARTGRSAE
jgi:hypothetical protein